MCTGCHSIFDFQLGQVSGNTPGVILSFPGTDCTEYPHDPWELFSHSPGVPGRVFTEGYSWKGIPGRVFPGLTFLACWDHETGVHKLKIVNRYSTESPFVPMISVRRKNFMDKYAGK